MYPRYIDVENRQGLGTNEILKNMVMVLSFRDLHQDVVRSFNQKYKFYIDNSFRESDLEADHTADPRDADGVNEFDDMDESYLVPPSPVRGGSKWGDDAVGTDPEGPSSTIVATQPAPARAGSGGPIAWETTDPFQKGHKRTKSSGLDDSFDTMAAPMVGPDDASQE